MRLVLALLLLLAMPATASASRVYVALADGCQGDVACSKYGGAPPVPITSFEGGAGEANRVAVRREGGTFVIRDDGAALLAESPCTSVDAHSARCPVTEGGYGLHGLGVGLGDGDDWLTIAADLRVETSIFGGDGKDVVEAGAEPDTVDGGAGGDRLLGGGGVDELSYAGRTAPVVANLATESGGEVGEDDAFGNFEVLVGGAGDVLFGNTGADRLSGGAGDDRLYGDPAQGDDYYTPIIRLLPDRLDGGRGDDLLSDTGGRNRYFGGPGADVLEGGAGPDRMDAGAGADLVRARGGGRDRVRCGPGRDRARTDLRDSRRSCERR